MKRSFSHWSVRYARDRLRLAFFELANPDAPWLAPEAVRFLDAWLKPNYVGFEWGSGRSTVWFSWRVKRLTSVEHDEVWYRRVQQTLRAHPRNNVDLRHIPVDMSEAGATAPDSHAGSPPAYVTAISEFSDHSLDFVLVDGVSVLRDACALAAIAKIRSGGALILDDIHRYLPSDSRSPLALPKDAGPLTSAWNEVAERLHTWEYRGCSSGVTDTGVWIR